MAAIRELLKGREVYSVQANNTVFEAATYMMNRNVGAVPVLKNSDLVGVFSERDIVRRVMLANLDWIKTFVGDVMTDDPLVIRPTEEVENCMLLMKQHGFRHLPVCDGDKLVGFVSMRDLLLHDLDAKEIEVRMMRSYMASGME
jgi:CBS domain-containing protein